MRHSVLFENLFFSLRLTLKLFNLGDEIFKPDSNHGKHQRCRRQAPACNTSQRTEEEGKEGTITLKEDDPQVIEAMLHWFYEYDYVTPQNHERPLELDLDVYIAAEKYDLQNLKRLAATKFERRAEHDWRSNRFASAIFEAYNCLPESDRVLKQKIARIVSKHRMDLFHPVKGSETFKVLTVKVPEFGRDVLIASSDTGDDGEREKYRCPTCTKCWYIEKETQYFVCPKGCAGPRTMRNWAQYKEC
ncbi:hypothetical protein D0862_14741 [Hortaea werneckii]|uniref:BTB domain-containing protein n=1 Tax=Hortaea werneckii TaxID=91943 RepID=A0A3M7E2Q2_HORWE|nr:hypothetical protein D0862_14741 [Hortaea werneckii]